MRQASLLLLICTAILGCSVYQSNARKNFETRSPSYVVSFSAASCEATTAPESFHEYSKTVNEFGQVMIFQVIPHENNWYACTELYESEQAWQEHQSKFNSNETVDDLIQQEGI